MKFDGTLHDHGSKRFIIEIGAGIVDHEFAGTDDGLHNKLICEQKDKGGFIN